MSTPQPSAFDEPRAGRLEIADPASEAEYQERVRARGLRLHDDFEALYVEREWAHGRQVFDGLVEDPRGKRVLEFGCHYGGSAVVLAKLGAHVTGIDPDPDCFEIARLNARRFGVADRIDFAHVPDTRTMPFPDESFDWVSCNSVLEYVAPHERADVQREMARVLRPGGLLFVIGTASRLWPREIHTKRWVNWIPERFDRLLAERPLRRGVSPWSLRFGFGPGWEDVTASGRGRPYVAMKRRTGTGGAKLLAMELAANLASRAHLSLGLLAPSMAVILRKPTR